jgi:hypothetical protein
MPHVWQETVTPLKKDGGADGSALETDAVSPRQQNARPRDADNVFIKAIGAV